MWIFIYELRYVKPVLAQCAIIILLGLWVGAC